MSTSIFSNPSFNAKMFQLPGKCLTPGISCFLSILSRDTTMLRFSLNTGNIFRFLGSFLPASPGIFGNVARLMTRNIFTVINSAMNWNSMVSLTPGCVDELNFGRLILLILTACPCGLLSVSPRGLFTLMPLFQPAVASLLLMAKFFTKIGPTSRDPRVLHSVSS